MVKRIKIRIGADLIRTDKICVPGWADSFSADSIQEIPIETTLECPICGKEPREECSDNGYRLVCCNCGAGTKDAPTHNEAIELYEMFVKNVTKIRCTLDTYLLKGLK